MTNKSGEVLKTQNSAEDLFRKIQSLEKIITEERQRTIVLEKQLQLTRQTQTCPNLDSDKQFNLKRYEMLQRELDEKDELIDAKDEQILDMKTRVEQMRKMNDALRALLEKEPGEGKSQGAHKMEATVEIASYQKEIESMRKEMQILRGNILQAEKVREKLGKENRELQEELKLREDSIFDQDDELEKRNNEIKTLKLSLEQTKRESEQIKRELTQIKSTELSGVSGRLGAKIAEIERLRMELNSANQEMKDFKQKHDELIKNSRHAEDTLKQATTELNHLRNLQQEKEKEIIEINKNLKQSTDTIENYKSKYENAELRRSDAEKQLEEVKEKLLSTEQELKTIRLHMDEANVNLTTSVNNNVSEMNQDSQGNRDLLLSRRNFEIDKLRRELSLMRRERDDLFNELKKIRIKLDKRQILDERGRKDNNFFITSVMGNTYAKALSTQQNSTKINLLNEHISLLNRTNCELKIQNESLHHNVIDYQRRYRSIKEQYEGEQETWLTERVVLESKAKEYEDRRLTITNTRKMLQDTSIKLYELEKESGKKILDLHLENKKLEEEKLLLESKLAQYEEHQKLPKVLQRFSGTSTTARQGVLASQARSSAIETSETVLKLQTAEKTINKLRAELNELKDSKCQQQIDAIKDAESARLTIEKEMEDLKDRLVTMECYRQEVELFRHRQYELEEVSQKEFKSWQQERDQLIYLVEEARVMIDQWCTQIKCRSDNEETKAEDTVDEVIKSMEKWCTEHDRLPTLKRKTMESASSIESTSGIGLSPGPMNSPLTNQSRNGIMISSTTTPFSPLALARLNPLTAQRSTSMEWSGGRFHGNSGQLYNNHIREGSYGFGTVGGTSMIGGLRGSSLSLATSAGIGGGSNYSLMVNSRCGRSVSPEVTVKKISHYPDPTPGFLVRPQSRQGSQDSLASITDYSQRSFTLPGKPPMRSIISPARRLFFEDNTSNNSINQLSMGPNMNMNNNNKLLPTDSQSILFGSLQLDNVTKSPTLPSSPITSTPIITNKENKFKNSENNKDKSYDSHDLQKTIKSMDKSDKTNAKSFTQKFAHWSSTLSNNDNNNNNLSRQAIKAQSAEPTSASNSNSKPPIQIKADEKLKDKINKKDKSITKLLSTDKNKIVSSTHDTDSNDMTSKSNRNVTTISATTTITTRTTTASTTQTPTTGISTSTPSITTATAITTTTKSTISSAQNVKRSKSVSNISPAIMALRQKFSGGKS